MITDTSAIRVVYARIECSLYGNGTSELFLFVLNLSLLLETLCDSFNLHFMTKRSVESLGLKLKLTCFLVKIFFKIILSNKLNFIESKKHTYHHVLFAVFLSKF